MKLIFVFTFFDLGFCDVWYRVGGRERVEVVVLIEGGGRRFRYYRLRLFFLVFDFIRSVGEGAFVLLV